MGFDLVGIFQTVIDGVLFGSTYALIGMGFTLIFGAMEKLNMAFAASSIGGAYIGLGISTLLGLPLFLTFFIGPIAAGLLGLLVYLTCFRFIPSDNHLGSLMASIGALFFIDEVIIHETNGSPLNFPELGLFAEAYFEFGEFGFRGDLIFIMLLSFVFMGVIMYVLYKTRLGLATRAVSQQHIASLLCGIPTHKTNAVTFVLAGVLGGFAGCLVATSVGVISPLLTLPITIKGLIAAVIGGLGSIRGAIIAGLLIGGLENLFLLLRGVNERDIYVFLLLFLFLVFRPNGLLGSTINRD
jgi:branched-subunit amino acid ABC-type transport system permease component